MRKRLAERFVHQMGRCLECTSSHRLVGRRFGSMTAACHVPTSEKRVGTALLSCVCVLASCLHTWRLSIVGGNVLCTSACAQCHAARLRLEHRFGKSMRHAGKQEARRSECASSFVKGDLCAKYAAFRIKLCVRSCAPSS